MEKITLVAGCAIFVVLGAMHLWLTFFGTSFEPREAKLADDMKRVNPVLTRQTTMWKAWVGFNASHSLGAILFGAVYIVIALENYSYLRTSIALNVMLLSFPLAYLALAIKYWFSKPRTGVLLASVLILLSMILRMFAQ